MYMLFVPFYAPAKKYQNPFFLNKTNGDDYRQLNMKIDRFVSQTVFSFLNGRLLTRIRRTDD